MLLSFCFLLCLSRVRPFGGGGGGGGVYCSSPIGFTRFCSGVPGAGGGLTGVPDKCRVVGRLLRGGKAGPAVTIVK